MAGDDKTITPYPDGSNGNNIDAVNILAKAAEIIEKRNQGAISKCSPEIIADLEQYISEGDTVRQAAEKAGVSEATYYRWMSVIPGFQEAMARAHKMQGTARLYKHQHIAEAMDLQTIDPKEQMAYLRKQEQLQRFDLEIAKRRDPGTWGDKQVNVNLNANVSDADVSKWFNR
jgi:transposase-like protein